MFICRIKDIILELRNGSLSIKWTTTSHLKSVIIGKTMTYRLKSRPWIERCTKIWRPFSIFGSIQEFFQQRDVSTIQISLYCSLIFQHLVVICVCTILIKRELSSDDQVMEFIRPENTSTFNFWILQVQIETTLL